METKKIFAGKIVPKSLLVKQHQKDKVSWIYLVSAKIWHMIMSDKEKKDINVKPLM